MGCNTSAPTQHEQDYKPDDVQPSTSVNSSNKKGNSAKGSGKLRRSVTETKISQALLKKKMEQATADKPLTFEKILLKFDKLRLVIGYVKSMFDEVAVNGSLDDVGLQEIMKRLSVSMTLEEILDLFDFVNVQERTNITIKEFLVALTIGMVLDAIPALTSASGKVINPEKSFSGFLGHHDEIKELLNLIVTAYLLFDTEGKGYIERQGIEKTLAAHGNKKGMSHAFLSQERWAEMDWDGNGTIDFAEFVFSLTSWVDVEEEE